jgi:hypothetical protein
MKIKSNIRAGTTTTTTTNGITIGGVFGRPLES